MFNRWKAYYYECKGGFLKEYPVSANPESAQPKEIYDLSASYVEDAAAVTGKKRDLRSKVALNLAFFLSPFLSFLLSSSDSSFFYLLSMSSSSLTFLLPSSLIFSGKPFSFILNLKAENIYFLASSDAEKLKWMQTLGGRMMTRMTNYVDTPSTPTTSLAPPANSTTNSSGNTSPHSSSLNLSTSGFLFF